MRSFDKLRLNVELNGTFFRNFFWTFTLFEPFFARPRTIILFLYRNWICRDRYKYTWTQERLEIMPWTTPGGRNAACDSLRSSFFLTLTAAAVVYHRASDGASLPSPFVHAFSVRFPRINKIPLWRHTAGAAL